MFVIKPYARKLSAAFLARCALTAGLAVRSLAFEVEIKFVGRGSDGRNIPLEQVQSLWKSPFGGFVASAWPFGIRVDDEPVLAYRTATEKLMDQSAALAPAASSAQGDALSEFIGEKPLEPSDLAVFRMDRASSARLNLGPGDHMIRPGNMRFSITPDGELRTADGRLRIGQDGKSILVVCHPVVITAVAESGEPVPAVLSITWGGADITGGLADPIRELLNRTTRGNGESAKPEFRKITLYLPISAPDAPYKVGGERFDVMDDGTVSVPEGSRLMRSSANELRIPVSRAVAQELRVVGIRWWSAAKGIVAAAGGSQFASNEQEGSGFLEVPKGSRTAIKVGSAGATPTLTLSVDGNFDSFPFKTVMLDASDSRAWLVEQDRFLSARGGEIHLRIVPLTAGAQKAEGKLEILITPFIRHGNIKAAGVAVERAGDNAYILRMPDSAGQGLWKMESGETAPFGRREIGLVRVTSDGNPNGSVSIFTWLNRGISLQGEKLDVFWAFAPGSAAANERVRLRIHGPFFKTEGPVLGPFEGKSRSSGHLVLDTEGLPSGEYEVTAETDQAVVYPARFRICSSPKATDIGIYSYVFGQLRPSGAGLLTACYAGNPSTEEGLGPLRASVASRTDPALVVFAAAQDGPAIEWCSPTPQEEAGMMALVLAGPEAIPEMPSMLHHEEWNPKHSLPDELATMRRRLALFAQKYADVPGFAGVALNWYATLNGYWEESKPLDGRQAERNRAAAKWIAERVAERVEEARRAGASSNALESVRRQAQFEYQSSVLPNAYAEYIADAVRVKPGLSFHTGIPSFWLGGGHSHPAFAYKTLTHRDAVDYTDYGISPWGNFRVPAFLEMGNLSGQPTRCCYATSGRHSMVVTAFGALGRGLKGISLNPSDPFGVGEEAALFDILRRFGSFFAALQPLKDTAVYFSAVNPWPQQKSVILHDLARMRRPGMLLCREDVLAGRLKGYRVLVLAAVPDNEPDDVIAAFRDFEKAGGIVLRDRTCGSSIPGRDLGFGWDDKQVHNGWGLAWPNGEWEFAHLWVNFLEHREKHLAATFKDISPIPVSTSDNEALISPLAGQEIICCFAINSAYVPMSIEGKWRQHAVLPRKADLLVEKGWHVRDLLEGRECVPEGQASGYGRIAMDFSRMEGRIYLLSRRNPTGMEMKIEPADPAGMRVTAWLTDEAGAAIQDPMPFEVSLVSGAGGVCFHKYAALGPAKGIDVPTPRFGGPFELRLTDLVLGCSAARSIPVAAKGEQCLAAAADVIGRDAVVEFLKRQKGPVVILLDPRQNAYRTVAEQARELLRRSGREADIQIYDPAEVRLVSLRWKPLEEDIEIIERIRSGSLIGWRVNMSPFYSEKSSFEDPSCGYAEYGPRTWLERDAILLGGPEDHLALKDLEPFLRRKPLRSYPSEGNFFVHYLWDPFHGGHDAIYIGCRDRAGAEAGIRFLEQIAKSVAEQRPDARSARPDLSATTLRGGPPAGVTNMQEGRIGTRVLDAKFDPSGDTLFVTLDSYGESLFAFGPGGAMKGAFAAANRCGNSLWYRAGGALRPLDGNRAWVTIGGWQYLFDLKKGFVSRRVNPPHGLQGRFKVPVAGSTVLEDERRGVIYLGGARKLKAIRGSDGGLAWSYDDAAWRTRDADMLYPRSLFPRALSHDGRFLLVAGFGIKQDCYGIGTVANESVFCLDVSSGKMLWNQEGTLLNEGKALALDESFLIVDDRGGFRFVDAATGRELGSFRPVERADFLIPVPAGRKLLIVENNCFDSRGPTACARLRNLESGQDMSLDGIAGRVTDATVSADGTMFILTERGEASAFASDGRKKWRASVPTGGVLAVAPDGATVVGGSREGSLLFLDAKDGRSLRKLDLNCRNLTTGERFVSQMNMLKDVPEDARAKIRPEPVEPSYVDSLAREAVHFGSNLVASAAGSGFRKASAPEGWPAGMDAFVLDHPLEASMALAPGRTYLVEWVACAGESAAGMSGAERIEFVVETGRKSTNLPFAARLSVPSSPTRQRLAFRSDDQTSASIRVRVIRPRTGGEGKKDAVDYSRPHAVEAGVLFGGLHVREMTFSGRNIVLDRGPGAKVAPRGSLECQVKPWTGGNSTIRWMPYPCPDAALRMVDGVVANQQCAWTTAAKGPEVEYAEGVIRFRKPQRICAVAVYEDCSGPVVSGGRTLETIAPHFGIYVNEKGKGWRRVGYAFENRNMVNVFTFPPVETDAVRYFWAGRDFGWLCDGIVRSAEIEVYSTEDDVLSLDSLDEQGAAGENDGLGL